MGDMVDGLSPRSGFSRLWYVILLGILLLFIGASYVGARYSMSLQTKALSATDEQELKALLENTWASRDRKVLAAIAKNPHASPNVLREVSHHSNFLPTVRLELADNPNTPADVLRDLARTDYGGEVMSRVSVNPNTPRDVIRSIVSGRQQVATPSVGWQQPRALPQAAPRSLDSAPMPAPTTTPTPRQPSASSSDITSRMPRQPTDR